MLNNRNPIWVHAKNANDIIVGKYLALAPSIYDGAGGRFNYPKSYATSLND